ncbi:MAG: hypothetical protein COB49_13060 [Alphaproteobacteria bacterium]|nr:MAG: hypothetical protein COB49_13060 [Alphaproteobacteria bacterium]
MRKRAYPIVSFCLAANDNTPVTVRGRNAETLLKLIERGTQGLTAYDFAGGPPYRLGAYIAYLRALGLSIETLREAHDCGWHARYVLHTPVTVSKVQEAANDR